MKSGWMSDREVLETFVKYLAGFPDDMYVICQQIPPKGRWTPTDHAEIVKLIDMFLEDRAVGRPSLYQER